MDMFVDMRRHFLDHELLPARETLHSSATAHTKFISYFTVAETTFKSKYKQNKINKILQKNKVRTGSSTGK